MKEKIVFFAFSLRNSMSTKDFRQPNVIHSLFKAFWPTRACACFWVVALSLLLFVQSVSATGENNQPPAGSFEQCQKLAEQGNVEAQRKLGRMYEEGLGVKQDYREAVKWYLKAAEKGNAQAQYKLGTMYALGKGVRKDRLEAGKWFGKAAGQGYEPIKQQILETGSKLKDQLLKDPLGVLQRRVEG
jgi:hypothetical protein